MSDSHLGWVGIVRLGLVQTALGAIVVLTTSTLNRVMVVEMALPATLPGLLVGLHYAVQVMRPRMGYGSDLSGRLTPWIVGGMAVLTSGGILAALATAWMASRPAAGIALAVLGFLLIGAGVAAAGTSLLVLLAKRVEPMRRPAAATIVWLMMIAGFAITAGFAGRLLDPFSPERLVAVTAGISSLAFAVAAVAVWRVEGASPSAVPGPAEPSSGGEVPFREAIAEVWREPRTRRFAVFVFVSMLAYSAQDLILEPFAGVVFGLTPGQSTQLAGIQHGGVLAGMVLVAVAGTAIGGPILGSLRGWTIGGCIASAVALAGLAVAGSIGPAWPLRSSVFVLGAANGVFAVAAIGSMMNLAGTGRSSREGTRMGLWGAAQAVAFGLGGLAGTVAVDIARLLLGSPLASYSLVFAVQAALFVLSAALAARVGATETRSAPARMTLAGQRAAGVGGG